MNHKNSRKAGFILAGILLMAVFLYFNRKPLYPEVREVTYLRAELEDTVRVRAGIMVENVAPFSFQVDSVLYQIRHKGRQVGWGNQLVKETLPPLANEVFDLQLFLNKDAYKSAMASGQNQDSIALDVQVQVYLDPPLLPQQTIHVNRRLKIAVPKTPAFKIDTFFVKNFSPEAGYTFQLNLNTGQTGLPNLKIEDLRYRLQLADSITISGKIDTVLEVKSHQPVVQLPIHLKTPEVLEGIALKLGKKQVWSYEIQASATLKAVHALFPHTAVTVSRPGTLDLRKTGNNAGGMPSVKKINALQLTAREKTTFLQAEIQIHNPTMLPLYLDSARYRVRSGGKLLAWGGDDHEKVFPAKADETLQLKLAVANGQYEKLLGQPKTAGKIPLEVELLLHYNLKDSKPRQFVIRKKLAVPVTESPSFELVDIGVKELDPDKGAALFVKLKVENKSQIPVSVDDLHYRLQLENDIDISGKTRKPILIAAGTTEVEVPVDLSGKDVNDLARGLIQGKEVWPYAFSGTALVSTPNSLLHRTAVSLKTSGVYNVDSKGSPDFMPEFSKIDTLNVAIRYDTAWAHMYAAIYNTLPATIHVTKLQVDVIHASDTVAKTEEKLNLYLAPNANSFAWHTIGIHYGLWEKHVKEQQHQDSMLLHFPTRLFFNLGNLGKEEAELELKTQIPTPASPVILLQKTKIKGFSFRNGLQFDAQVAIQNANSPGLTVKNITYDIVLENGVDLCGTVNREYKIPLGISEVHVPISLSVWESLKMLKRQLLGPPLLDYQINATGQLRTDNPKLSNVFVIFENRNQTNLKEKKTLREMQ